MFSTYEALASFKNKLIENTFEIRLVNIQISLRYTL